VGGVVVWKIWIRDPLAPVVVPRTAHAGSRRYSPSSLVWCGPRAPPCPRPPLASSRPAGRPVPSYWSRPRSRTVVGHRRSRGLPEVRGAEDAPYGHQGRRAGGGAGRGRRRRARKLGGAQLRGAPLRPYLRPQAWRPSFAEPATSELRATAARGGRPTRHAARTASTGSGARGPGSGVPRPRCGRPARASRLGSRDTVLLPAGRQWMNTLRLLTI
jgi:hypothetical protein